MSKTVNKLREDLAEARRLFEEAETARFAASAILLAVIQKYGGKIVMPKQDFALVTRKWAIAQSVDPQSESITLMAVMKKEEPRG